MVLAPENHDQVGADRPDRYSSATVQRCRIGNQDLARCPAALATGDRSDPARSFPVPTAPSGVGRTRDWELRRRKFVPHFKLQGAGSGQRAEVTLADTRLFSMQMAQADFDWPVCAGGCAAVLVSWLENQNSSQPCPWVAHSDGPAFSSLCLWLHPQGLWLLSGHCFA